jgi:hypothetical protein
MSVSRAETRWQWQERLARFASSDLTVAQFCMAEQVSDASFYLWRRRFRESADSKRAADSSPSPLPSSASTAARRPRLLPVVMSQTVRSDALHSSTLELELPNQICLRMPRDIEVEFVGQLLSTCAALATHPAPASSGRSEAR